MFRKREALKIRAASLPGRPGRNSSVWSFAKLLHLLIFGCLIHSVPALADEFDRMVSKAENSGTVSVLVSGWQAITGDNVFQSDADALSSGNFVAITGSDFLNSVKSASPNVRVKRQFGKFPVLALEMDAKAMRVAKQQNPNLQVWENRKLQRSLAQSAPIIAAPAAWQNGYTGQGKAVVIIDDGVDRSHPFLNGHVILEACFADVCPNGKNTMFGEGAATPVGTHGTHVAGIAAGYSKSRNMAGIAPNSRIIAINVFNKSGGASGDNIMAALLYAANLASKNPDMIGAVNMSLGAERTSPGICTNDHFDQIANAMNQLKVPVVVASGNGSKASAAAPVAFPACIDGFISVGAITKNGAIAPFSNSGPALDLMAPGYQIMSSALQEDQNGHLVRRQGNLFVETFEAFSGTSMAAPHVTGALAVLKQASPESSTAELLAAIVGTGTPVRDSRNNIVAPLINVEKAIAALRGSSATPKPPAAPQPPSTPPSPPPQAKQPAKPPQQAQPPARAPQPTPAPQPAPKPKAPEPKEKKEWQSITG